MFSLSSVKPNDVNNRNQSVTNGIVPEIEETSSENKSKTSVTSVTKRKRGTDEQNAFSESELNNTWRDVLGNPPPIGNTRVLLL